VCPTRLSVLIRLGPIWKLFHSFLVFLFSLDLHAYGRPGGMQACVCFANFECLASVGQLPQRLLADGVEESSLFLQCSERAGLKGKSLAKS